MKIAFVTTDWVNGDGTGLRHEDPKKQYGGVGYYRAYKPAEYLRELGHEVDIYGSDFKDQFDGKNIFSEYKKFVKQYDRVVIKQADNRFISYLIGACHEASVPIIMDLDDNFLEVFKGQPALQKGYSRGGTQKAYSAAAMSMCDALFVSTEPLKEYFSNVIKYQFGFEMPIYVLPNCNDVKDWQGHTTTDSDDIFIGWHGSITHDEDLKLVLPTIRRLMKKYKNLWLQLVGGIREESIKELFGDWKEESWISRISIVGGTPSWDGFPELLMSMPWDIGIAPLVNNKFNESKSHIKWMEMAMMKCPVVASKVAPYDVIDHGVTGFLCKNGKEWKDTLEKLIENPTLRGAVGGNAYVEVVKNWQYKDKIHLWETALESVSKNAENIAKFSSQESERTK